MGLSPTEISAHLERILPGVQKPGRYVGGEMNQIVKDWESTPTRIALAFPDIYDIGLPNLGLAIFYELLNQQPDVLAERTYLPWTDMERAMRQSEIPAYSLESKRALADFDILALTLPYETLYTNTLNLLDLAGIPFDSASRNGSHPLLIAGGHAAYNPEPMARFIDAFVIGEGEEVILEIVHTYQSWKSSGSSWDELLLSLASLDGVYVPSLYQPVYHPNAVFAGTMPIHPQAPAVIRKRIVGQLPPPPTHFVVPNIDVVHNRVAVEIMRGCTRGCRFCHAGYVNRPVRERPVEQVLSAIQIALQQTGYEEVALLSLSSSDYTQISELVDAVSQQASQHHLVISLPSLRIESFSVDLMDRLKGSRQGGFTLAPEAASERMRRLINKPISTDQLLETAEAIYSRGYSTLKLYFMIGHPSETLEDVQAIADLCKAVMSIGRRCLGKRASLHAGVSTFVPKAHTPFQWAACDTVEQIARKQDLLRRELRAPGIKYNWTEPGETMLEAWLSRGDRRLGDVILKAWQLGAKFDAWQDQLHLAAWEQAFTEAGLDSDFYTHRIRPLDEHLPWDHIHTGVKKTYLQQEYRKSVDLETTADCRDQCHVCGILPDYNNLRRDNPGTAWMCPEVSPRKTGA